MLTRSSQRISNPMRYTGLISGNIETNNLKTAKKELQQGSENIFNIIIVSVLINVTNSIVYLYKKGQSSTQKFVTVWPSSNIEKISFFPK